MTFLEKAAVAIVVASILGGAIVVAAGILHQLWRERREEPDLCVICGEPECASMKCIGAAQARLNDYRLAQRAAQDTLDFGGVLSIPVAYDDSMPGGEVRAVGANGDVVRMTNLGGFDWPASGPAPYDWQADRGLRGGPRV